MKQEPEQSSQNKFRSELALLGGVVLPFAALLVELVWGASANIFVDPIPTIVHALLVGFVPVANLYLIWCIVYQNTQRPRLMAFASALVIGVSILYSILFVPVSLFSLAGIVLLGFGLLGFAPMTAFAAIWYIRKNLKDSIKIKSFALTWKGVAFGFILTLVLVGISESRFIFTKYALELASAENAEQQEKGLRLLRNFGNTNYLLKLSKGGQNAFYFSDTLYNLLNDSESTSTAKAREIYYRLHGERYESGGDPDAWLFDRMDTSGDGNRRFRKNKDLSMVESEIKGSIDNEAAVGYLEWRLKFKNAGKFRQAEAVGQIQLPSGAVVSRLTLWVKGEEREAAFAERSRVTKAYEDVVSTKRDPVLVTTAGRDRVDMKCFPVMPDGGEMQIRIGITFPLTLESRKKGAVRLPHFRHRNFVIGAETKHNISILATDKLEAEAESITLRAGGAFLSA